MKQLVIFICLFVFLLPLTSFAEDDDVIRGQVGQQKRLKLYTDQQLDEALAISDECKAYDRTSVRYDCDCVGMTFLDLRRIQGEKASAYWLRESARRKCPNTPAMAGKIYSACVQKAPSVRPEDYEEFCQCYGSSFAKLFGKNPTDNLIVIEAQTVNAMQSCNVNAVNVRDQDRATFVQQLKDRKIYDKLFPGAVDDYREPTNP